MKTIIILSALAFIFLLTFTLVKSAQYISKKFAVKWRELKEWFDNKFGRIRMIRRG